MSSEQDEAAYTPQTQTPLLKSYTRQSGRPSPWRRQQSILKYNTYPAAPPRNIHVRPHRRGRDMSKSSASQAPSQLGVEDGRRRDRPSSRGDHHEHEQTPLPKGQLAILAVIALAEQTALNSISPYLPEMASTFPEVDPDKVGMYVGAIASAFALAQCVSNYAWGWLSDRIGRKPVVLIGTFFTACCFVAFGFCRTLWQAILVQLLMGLVNGNQGVVSTCLGEITDRSNQSQAFTYLPVLYGLGGITGPIVGGLMVFKENPFRPGHANPYPFLFPNLFSALVLLIDFGLTLFFLRESLECAQDFPAINQRLKSLFASIWQFTNSHRPTYTRKEVQAKNGPNYGTLTNRTSNSLDQNDGDVEDDDEDEDEDDDDEASESSSLLANSSPDNDDPVSTKEALNRDTVLLLGTFLIFQLSNISYNSLYPIFAQARPPTGRQLTPEEIGISLAFAGIVTIIFQIGLFGHLREKIGNKITYRASHAGFVIAFLLMPWIGYKDGSNGTSPPNTTGEVWLWIELGAVLIVKTVASVGGLTSVLLLITNSAPSHKVLGRLNGLAQTLSAAGRAVGPFISGALFSAATKVRPKGEALAFGVFAGVAFLGFLLSFGIRGQNLEAEGWEESDSDEEGTSDSDNDGERTESRGC